MSDIKHDFDITNDKSGLLQTAFILSYMVFAPLFGYLGDRYNRKFIMSSGVFLWCLTTLIGSYMKVSTISVVRVKNSRLKSNANFMQKHRVEQQTQMEDRK